MIASFRFFHPIALALSALLLLAPEWSRAGSDALVRSGLKEWTFLTYLNGNNNLDPYGGINVNQMETVGSTAQVNVVVQWASESAKSARRLYITRDTDRRKVTSPVLQELKGLDMGDWRNLVEFIRWGVEQYPAKRYFVNIWSHGTGWREPEMQQVFETGVSPFDISPDDLSGNAITTRQLGMAMTEASRIIGRKIDIYGSDACLMGMLEIAAEMSDSVEYFIGSQATEPGDGWPYQAFLSRWTAKPDIDAATVSKLLARTYIETYSGPDGPKKDATLSAFDLKNISPVTTSLRAFSTTLQDVVRQSRKEVLRSARSSLQFTLTDYVDLGDFLAHLRNSAASAQLEAHSARLREALSSFIVANQATPRFQRASGVSIWIPTNRDLWDRFGREYERLRFHADTGWGTTLRSLAQ
ncbi:MAG: hypothetical protein A2X94_00635 [Bdellovibrionales bacterium GWB1_55_8]|nr:MAG: hypothetical protein A2X94_00635 [Bdellovibrionales bacterium GWB1_55_8]